MSWSEEYNENEVVADYTKPLGRIWDTLMPTSYPYVLEFKTNKAVEVNKNKSFGPYSMWERFIDFDCDVVIDKKPLLDIGWENGEISSEMAKKAYGETYFHDLRGKMVELMKYAGLKFSQFDFGGNLNASVKDD